MGKAINKGMFGLFFEDINYGLDGGLHAEMLENRAFEFVEAHGYKCNYYQKGAYLYGWNAYPFAPNSELRISDSEPLNDINPHYLILKNNVENAGFSNKAYEGIYLRAGESADISFYAKASDKRTVTVNIFSKGGKRLCHSEEIFVSTDAWKKYETKITAKSDIEGGLFVVLVREKGEVSFDQFRMYPEGAVLGLFRKDLVMLLKDLKPGFMRFPGGCVVEGNDLANRYQWKLTAAPSEERKSNWNRWAVHGNDSEKKDLGDFPYYNQTLGIGFYEYFLLCEYLGCEPLPVMNVGLACQYQSDQLIDSSAPAFKEYIDDALDLIEFANGDVATRWGAVRAAMGHEKPFNLKYIGIGNEQWETEKVDFFHRYDMFEAAIHEKYPEIKCCGSAGPDVTSDHYRQAWNNFAPKMKAKSDYSYAVDEHYYVSDEWLYDNVHMYDVYDRHRKVFAGEYACHINPDAAPEKRNSFGAALAEAAFMTGLEKNSDVVLMASYAPLFARLGFTQWQPDLIWFDAAGSYGTPSYYVQKIYSNFTGTELIDVDFTDLEKDRVYVTASRDDRKVYVKIINAGEKEASVDLTKIVVSDDRTLFDIAKENVAGKGTVTVHVMQGNKDDCNSIAEPEKVALVSSSIELSDYYTSEAMSISVLEIDI